MLSAQVDLNSDSVAFVNAQLGLNQAKRTLNVLLNRAVQQEFTIDSAVEFQETLNVAAITERALQQNWDYLAAVNRFEQAKLDLGIAKSADYPHLSLYSTYGYDQTTSQFGVALDKPDRNFTAGVTLSLNLFNGFKTGIAKQNARINIDSQALLQEKARLELQEAVANAFEAYQNSRYVLAIEQRNLQSAELNFKRTQELYNLGQATTTTFREAQLNLVQAKNNIANAKFTAKVLEFELLRLSGGLVERHQI